jgi:hypothetical protein
VNYAILPYKDFGDADHLQASTILDFTNNINVVNEKVDSLAAHGGGDLAEDVFGALTKATTLHWTDNSIKFLVLIGDAPAHGADYNGNLSDNRAHNPGHTATKIVECLVQKKIDLIFCRIVPENTKAMEDQLKVSLKTQKLSKNFKTFNFQILTI